MIRHGAELVHAYCAATVPRLCVVMRKAYGGAYIVMDSRGIGNDLCVAWPGAEIAVMGGPAAVQILHGRRLARARCRRASRPRKRARRRVRDAFSNPYRAAERGLVDAVIDPADTRRVLCDALDVLATKRDAQPARRHSQHTALEVQRGKRHAARRQADPRHRRAERRVHRLLGRQARAGGRRRGRAHVVRPGDEPHAAGGPPAADRAEVVELDVTRPRDLDALAERVGGRLDGVLHAIGFAPESCLGGGFLTAPWDDVAVALHVSAYSLKALAVACRPLMQRGGSIVGLDFDNSRVAWPVYDWMGVAKAAFESTARYLARDLGPDGIRVNLVAAGPVRTIAAKSIPGFEQFEDVWAERAPLGWDVKDPAPVATRVRRAALRPVPRDDRRDDPRRRRLPRRRRVAPPRERSRQCLGENRLEGPLPGRCPADGLISFRTASSTRSAGLRASSRTAPM